MQTLLINELAVQVWDGLCDIQHSRFSDMSFTQVYLSVFVKVGVCVELYEDKTIFVQTRQ